MDMDKKKLAAAMAAVYTYIRTGEEAAAMAQPPEPIPEPPRPEPMGNLNVWGLAGRQAMMNAGSMMQLRMFK